MASVPTDPEAKCLLGRSLGDLALGCQHLVDVREVEHVGEVLVAGAYRVPAASLNIPRSVLVALVTMSPKQGRRCNTVRLTHALLHAMRTRRTQRIDLTQADRWAAGDLPGPDHHGLAELLVAVKAPATAGELDGEHEAVVAFAAARRRAASPTGRSRVRKSRTVRTAVVSITAGLLLAASAGTAAAARTGNLPDDVQQHAHHLFSALDVPAPRTSPANTVPIPQPGPSETTSRPSPTPTLGGSTTSRAEAVAAGWCQAWSATADDSDAPWRKDLIEAAGGEQHIRGYCAALNATTHPQPHITATKPNPGKPSGSKKPQGKPGNLPTPDHTGKAK